MNKRIANAYEATKSILIGMRVTRKWSRRRPVTTLYPFARPQLSERFRGVPRLHAIAANEHPVETLQAEPQRYNATVQAAVEQEKLPSCAYACPAHVDVRGYVGLFAKGQTKDALELIRERCPLPASIGRVCTRPCETSCKRSYFDQPISIRDIKRYIADACMNNPNPKPYPRTKDKNIAIIGAGPSGLTAAQTLVKQGYGVTIYDKNSEGGGTLLTGIPSYRLPKDVLKWDVDAIRALGVNIKNNIIVGKDITLAEIIKTYDSVLIATGLPAGWNLDIEGESAQGVWGCLDLLRETSFGGRPELGKKVAVVGGGNVAMDGARTALRLGAEVVYLIYRRGMSEIPARNEEIYEALEEGVKFELLANPVRIITENGTVNAIECVRMGLGEPDASGRRRPQPIPDSEYKLDVDTVIVAIGQKTELDFLNGTDIAISDRGAVEHHTLTLQTSNPKVFIAGEVVTGAGAAIEAIASGHEAAESIVRYLSQQDLMSGRTFMIEPVNSSQANPDLDSGHPELYISFMDKERRRADMGMVPATERKGFAEVELGYTLFEAVHEANRCLSCNTGVCSGCTMCARACPALCIDIMVGEPDTGAKKIFYSLDISKCMFCGLCADACPSRALYMSQDFENSEFRREELLYDMEHLLIPRSS